MKRTAMAAALGIALAAPAAFGQWYAPSEPYYGRWDDRRANEARVIETRPLHVGAREECYNPRTGMFEERRDSRTRIGKGAAIGAVAGGVLGHQVDQGGGTAAGAVLGGLLGHHLERRSDRQDDLDDSNCRMISAYSGPQAYEVRYEYRGQEYITRLDHDPGSTLELGRDIAWDGQPHDNVAMMGDPTGSPG